MASLLVQKHSSSYHCSSTSKHQFSITILKIYLKYRRFFLILLFTLIFLQGNPIPARSVVDWFFFQSLDLIVKNQTDKY